MFWNDMPHQREGGRAFFFFFPSNPSLHVVRGRERNGFQEPNFASPNSSSIISPASVLPTFALPGGREGKKERKEGKSQLEGEERPPETKRIVEWTRHLPTSPGYQHRCGTTTMVHPFSPSLLPPLLLILNGHSSSMGARWKPASNRQGLFDKQKSEFLKVQEPAG